MTTTGAAAKLLANVAATCAPAAGPVPVPKVMTPRLSVVPLTTGAGGVVPDAAPAAAPMVAPLALETGTALASPTASWPCAVKGEGKNPPAMSQLLLSEPSR